VANQWGSVGSNAESQNVYQILDNVTKILGNHTLKFGVSFQAIRFSYQYAPNSRGQYSYNGTYTENPANPTLTGYAVADFLADQMNTAAIANAPNINDAQWYDSAYAQDDWKVTPQLTLNLGVRYDYYQPYKENGGQQANFIADPSSLGIGIGSAVYQLPNKAKNVDLGSLFLNTLAKDNVTVQYVSNERLATSQKTNFSPRIGFAYQAHPNTVFRGGFGIFYGGLMSQGNTNLGSNFPFSNSANIPALDCFAGNCPSLASQGISLETGLLSQTSGGLQNFVNHPGFHAIDTNIKTPYTMNYSFGMQQALSPNMVATVSYVGNISRHLTLYYDPNTTRGLFNPSVSTQQYQPFPDLGGSGTIHYGGVSTYNSLQAKLEKRYSHGLSFLATYTWSHALDDASDAAGNFSAIGDRNQALLPFITEFTNSTYDIRNRFTLNGNYELPLGKGRAFVNRSPKWADEMIGGWSTSLTFAAQSGTPFTVTPSNTGPAGGSARAIQVSDPFSPGGGAGCPSQVRTKTNWYNPCAFVNPIDASNIAPPGKVAGDINPSTNAPYLFTGPVTDTATVLALLGGRSNTIYGPGYYAVNMSLFKNFTTWHEQYLQFRADAFNVLNHPTLGNPSTTNTSLGAGNITGPKFFQNNTPDARFFQLSLKYAF
jgi:hypothetical protein